MTTYHTIVSYALTKVGPMTAQELAAELDMTEDTCRRAIRRSKEAKKVYVHDWKRGPRNSFIAVFAAGNCEDKEKPAGKERSQQGNGHSGPGLPVRKVTLHECGLKRRPAIEDMMRSVDVSNPFAVAMWNVAQGERA
ncbi:hypothetical protein CAL14_05495 [Bordetella genomosp. 9]|uniref:hypothetical protein n=1 Tax=Bordetella genomosp. 9 TaxID=1416803 RepID=UPI000A28DB58|nr:hypothetical protein [Bordetella genomosp. 9]ARP89809.1 hypothetical protein CAL14_05495 [Bordetella genomosp. 9]